jgi:hypothetical protein
MKVWVVVMLLSATALAQAPPVTLTCAGTKEECLQKEVLELRQALAQAQIVAIQQSLQAGWAKLETEVRARLKAKPEDEIDMATLTIKPKPETKQ